MKNNSKEKKPLKENSKTSTAKSIKKENNKSKILKENTSKKSKFDNTVSKDNKSKKKNKKSNGLQIFGILFTTLISAATLYLFIQVFDYSEPQNLNNLYLIAPLVAQIIVGIIVIANFATSSTKKNKFSVTFTNSDKPEKDKESKRESKKDAAKNQGDDLLTPEINVSLKQEHTANTNYDIENFYKNDVEVINGNMYTSVSSYDETIRALSSLGATDMEIIKINMSGNEKFNEILNQPRTQKTFTSHEIVKYFMSKPGTYTIKKRGKLNWTFKHSYKSFGMIRENTESYKVSIKCFPDAAVKLNEKYMALDDSNFPRGPLWFCFNEFCNLPQRVVKWIIDSSFQISVMQQTRTDKLREFKSPADLDIDLHDISARYKDNQNVIVYPKYTLIFTKASKADLFTYLEQAPDGVDVSKYTKEYYYKFTIADIAVSMLCGKGISDEFVTTLMEHIEEILM